jgi:hypothetical protein
MDHNRHSIITLIHLNLHLPNNLIMKWMNLIIREDFSILFKIKGIKVICPNNFIITTTIFKLGVNINYFTSVFLKIKRF